MGIFSWKPILMNLNLSYPLTSIMQWAGITSPEWEYNTALALAKEWKYEESSALLEKLVHLPSFPQRAIIYELYGDTLSLSSGLIDDVKKLYLLALEIEKNPRIERKIALLSTSSQGTGNTLFQEKSRNILIQSGSLSLDQTILTSTLDSLEQSESEKQKYLYPINGAPRSESDQLSDIRSFVDEWVERVDW